MEQQDSSPAAMQTAHMSEALQQCVDLLNEWLPALENSLQSMDLDETLEELHRADQTLLECSNDEHHLELLTDQRERFSHMVCTSLRIAAGTLRTAVEELEMQLGAIRTLQENDPDARCKHLIADLQETADQWSHFSERMTAFEYPSMTADLVRELIVDQKQFLRELRKSHHNATH